MEIGSCFVRTRGDSGNFVHSDSIEQGVDDRGAYLIGAIGGEADSTPTPLERSIKGPSCAKSCLQSSFKTIKAQSRSADYPLTSHVLRVIVMCPLGNLWPWLSRSAEGYPINISSFEGLVALHIGNFITNSQRGRLNIHYR